MTADSPCPSEHRLDQRALGELPPALVDEIEAHLKICERCAARIEERALQQKDFVVDLGLVRALQAQPPPPSVAWWRRPPTWPSTWTGAAGAAAAAAVLIVVTTTNPATNTTKGARTQLFVQDAAPGASSARALAANDVIHPGDVLQVTVTSDAGAAVGVVSRDGAGAVSMYAGEHGLVRVAAGAQVPLPQATKLDDVLGREQLAVVVCPVDHADIDVRGAVDHDVPGCVVERHAFTKVPR